jgi:type II secretory pathway pseudopilin PulG
MDRAGDVLRRAKTHRGAGGFTLTELLIVVGVIVLLIGLLVPGLSLVRQAARVSATKSVMNTVAGAATSFRNDNRRLPGLFGQQEIGSLDANARLLTQAENALLELSGGVMEGVTSSPATADFEPVVIEMGRRTLYVDPRAVGSASEGAGYLEIRGRYLGVPDAEDRVRTGGGVMPTLLDAWGRPMLVWSKNESAGRSPVFAELSTETVGDDSSSSGAGERALFYFTPQVGVTASERQRDRSLLGVKLVGNRVPGGPRKQIIPTLDGLLGHPGFPGEPQDAGDGTTLSKPLAGRGDVLVHSAGPDGVFLSHGGMYVPGEGGQPRSRIFSVWYEGSGGPRVGRASRGGPRGRRSCR